MQELFHQAILPVNILFTALLVVCIFYWLSVIVGALDIGSVDVDFDVDLDLDLDVDADVDADSSMGGGMASVLTFFNFGKLPFMILFTCLSLSMWVTSILVNYYIGGGSVGIALAMLAPNLFVSLVLTKFMSTPLIPLFKDFGKGNEAVRYIGKQCKILLPPTTDSIGQGEVNLEGNVLLINIKLIEDGQDLSKGDLATVLEIVKEKKIYLVDKI